MVVWATMTTRATRATTVAVAVAVAIGVGVGALGGPCVTRHVVDITSYVCQRRVVATCVRRRRCGCR